MGTLKDEMVKVLNEWDKQDEVISQPKQEKPMTQHITATQKLINLVTANPGSTSYAVRQLVKKHHPEIPDDSVSSMLKQLADRFVMHREDTGKVIQGKTLYAYTVIPEEEGKKMREDAARKLKAAQERAEKARAVKAAKKLAREQYDKMLEEKGHSEQRTGLSDLLPQPVATPAIYNTKPTWTAQEALNGLSVLQARELYVELKKIFGG